MLRLIVFPPAFGAPSASPFSTKALCLLEMAGVEYTAKLGDTALVAYVDRARTAIFPRN